MVAPTDAKLRWTSADLALFPDTGDRYEIIDGDLYVTRAPHWRHQDVITNISTPLAVWAKQHKQGKVLATPGFVFANDDNVIPDLVWVSNGTLENCVDEAGHFTAAPELAVEVVSKATKDVLRDRQIKLKLYSRVGVREYWIVDWQQQTVEIFRRSQARLELVATLFAEGELMSPLFEGFAIAVADIFS